MTLAIIGGGIAGLSAALACAVRGTRDIVLLERESRPFSRSSGSNAAIFRPLEVQHELVQLASRASTLYDELDPTLVRRTGLCLVARHELALEPLLATARALELPHESWAEATLFARAPWLAGGRSRFGLFLPSGGIIDLERLAAELERRAAAAGVTIRTGAAVSAIEARHGAVTGVRLDGGECLSAERVIDAAGAWASDVVRDVGFDVPLVSHRRHLVELAPPFPVDPAHPVCWNIESEVYFRPHGNLVLACPGDDTPHAAGVPATDPNEVARLRRALVDEAPALASADVANSWACLRTRAADGSLAVGPDPIRPGLHWLAGLGGHGMTVGLALGELLARQLHGDPDPLVESFAVTRFAP